MRNRKGYMGGRRKAKKRQGKENICTYERARGRNADEEDTYNERKGIETENRNQMKSGTLPAVFVAL